jgi:hydroxypyruvate reductase
LVEHLRPGVDLAALIEVTQTGLAAGWSIERLNSERTRLSAIKGGGLSRRLVHRAALALFISDVPGDDTRVIGGGLLGPSAGGEADQVDRAIVASLGDATNAVAEAGAAHGLQVETSPHRFDGEAEHVAREFVVALRASPADVLVWGGESVVRLPPQPGRGGRNQHLALAAAFALKNFPRAMVLAVGTDGTDGVTPDAGALVDSNTVERIELAGFDAQKALDSADSGTALEAAGDLIHTGPTGSNVCDLLVGMR